VEKLDPPPSLRKETEQRFFWEQEDENRSIPMSSSSQGGLPDGILLISFANPEFDSNDVFTWSLIHFVVSIVFLFLFGEYLLQDMFCDACMGFPGEDCSD